MILVISFALVSTLSAGAQGRGQSAIHSNGPNSTDRDTGKAARAADVGKKEKKGQKSKKDKDKDKGKGKDKDKDKK
jgi:hypothetical protein